jgi:UDP-N-acetylglucosamine 2-epimerase (non-hydrolysing)
VEAGLRTYDLSAPFPEEWNRRAISLLASLHFAPTLRAQEQLVREGIDESRILVTGNTAIDALRTTVRPSYGHPALQWAEGSRLLLLTAHRRESLGEPMRRAFRGIRRIVEELSDVKVLYPVHPNPAVRAIAEEELGGMERIRLSQPLEPLDFHNILARTYIAVTDSGGIQEEAPYFGVPTLVMRGTTERPEAQEAGAAMLIGNSEASVCEGMRNVISNAEIYRAMSRAGNPYGDGCASGRIADIIERAKL